MEFKCSSSPKRSVEAIEVINNSTEVKKEEPLNSAEEGNELETPSGEDEMMEPQLSSPKSVDTPPLADPLPPARPQSVEPPIASDPQSSAVPKVSHIQERCIIFSYIKCKFLHCNFDTY